MENRHQGPNIRTTGQNNNTTNHQVQQTSTGQGGVGIFFPENNTLAFGDGPFSTSWGNFEAAKTGAPKVGPSQEDPTKVVWTKCWEKGHVHSGYQAL